MLFPLLPTVLLRYMKWCNFAPVVCKANDLLAQFHDFAPVVDTRRVQIFSGYQRSWSECNFWGHKSNLFQGLIMHSIDGLMY